MKKAWVAFAFTLLIILGLFLFLPQLQESNDPLDKSKVTPAESTGVDGAETGQALSSKAASDAGAQKAESKSKREASDGQQADPEHDHPFAADVVKQGGIYGRVVFDETGLPASGVTLVAGKGRIEHTPLTTVSDAEGFFGFSGLEDGRWSVDARIEDFTARDMRGGVPIYTISEEKPFFGPVEVRLRAAEEMQVRVVTQKEGLPIEGASVMMGSGNYQIFTTDADGLATTFFPAGAFRVIVEADGYVRTTERLSNKSSAVPLFTIALDVAGVLQGTVRSTSGEPIADARLFARGRATTTYPVRSDADGTYRLANIPMDEVLSVNASAEGYKILGMRSIKVPSEQPIQTMDFELEPEVGDTSLVGDVVDEDGRPVPNAVVTAGRFREWDITTDAQGRWASPLFAYDTWMHRFEYQVVAEGYAPAVQKISLKGPVENLETRMVLKPGFPLSGVVVDRDGQPIEGVTAELQMAAFLRGGKKPREKTDAQGRFNFEALDVGMKLRFYKQGYARTLVTLDGTSDLEVVLRDEQFLLGRVLDGQSNQPVPEFTVSAYDRKRKRVQVFTSTRFQDPDGRFEFQANGRKSIALIIEAEGYAASIFEQLDVDHPEHELKLGERKKLLRVALVDQDGNPLARLPLRVEQMGTTTNSNFYRWGGNTFNNGAASIYTSDQNGIVEAEVNGGFPSQLLLLADGWSRVRQLVDAFPEDEDVVEVVLQTTPEAILEMEINRERFDNAFLNVSFMNQRQSLDAPRDSRPVVVLDKMPVGSAMIMLADDFGPDGVRINKKVDLVAGEVTRVRLGYDETFTLSGIATVDGMALSKPRPIYIFGLKKSEGMPLQRSVMTDALGAFQFSELPPDDYEIILAGSASEQDRALFNLRHQPHPIQVTISDGDEHINADFPGMPTVNGVSISPEITRITLESKSITRFRRTIIAQYQLPFRMERIPPGDYLVKAESEENFYGAGTNAILLGEVTIPDQPVFDLGELSLMKTGKLRLKLIDPSGTFRQSLRVNIHEGIYDNPFLLPTTPAVAQRVLFRGDWNTLPNVPLGTITVHVDTRMTAYKVKQALSRVDITADIDSVLRIHIEPITYFWAVRAEEAPDLTSGYLVNDRGETLQMVPLQRGQDQSGQTVIHARGFSGRDLPAGNWRVFVTDQTGVEIKKEITLIKGQTLRVTLD